MHWERTWLGGQVREQRLGLFSVAAPKWPFRGLVPGSPPNTVADAAWGPSALPPQSASPHFGGGCSLRWGKRAPCHLPKGRLCLLRDPWKLMRRQRQAAHPRRLLCFKTWCCCWSTPSDSHGLDFWCGIDLLTCFVFISNARGLRLGRTLCRPLTVAGFYVGSALSLPVARGRSPPRENADSAKAPTSRLWPGGTSRFRAVRTTATSGFLWTHRFTLGTWREKVLHLPIRLFIPGHGPEHLLCVVSQTGPCKLSSDPRRALLTGIPVQQIPRVL